MANEVIGGVFAFIGAIGGVLLTVYLTRRVEHGQWIIERRAEAFAKFLELIQTAFLQATDILHDKNSEPGAARGVAVTTAYWPMLVQARVVSIYLSQRRRADFVRLAEEYPALHDNEDVEGRFRKMEARLERIQEMFVEELLLPPWPLEDGRLKRIAARLFRCRH